MCVCVCVCRKDMYVHLYIEIMKNRYSDFLRVHSERTVL